MILNNTHSIVVGMLMALLVCSSCDRIERKLGKLTPESIPDSFSVRNVVRDFYGDTSIQEIRGIQVDINMHYMEYCLYTGKKQRVLQGINKIFPEETYDYTSDDSCYKTTKEDFYSHVVNEAERKEYAQFFWNFEKLKEYELYTCIKAPLRHYVIFDNSSDTVYHRMEELRD